MKKHIKNWKTLNKIVFVILFYLLDKSNWKWP
ncbi:Uncharacterised protein [Streptococcus agalactiae]|uniref:Uncharacterized protein n=2 Tax=Streptococcus TaxID=1301 RepID=A0AB38VH73_STRAG|nr:hypothetical protein SAG0021_09150 [Streptococcus agalactiae FSL S3-277]EPT38130.1 hypothetical protein SAG0029_02035 [Streptococcus agalactiae FSL S3-501]EPT41961.1 hypothetical protein SAG0030_08725 [Streptococcus agalactiae FSL S3-603]EPT48299.1 hypothetical protein SAG0042_02315 [Streptococcus agalactiae FSL F2-343]EPV81786.1 hypothetical protein SAG0007_00545 [Streptococcus agalactiae FSL C1-487]EPV90257.1 hypothetical protein SAG0023_06800 [Streptococcus agalactiae FSL S3-105]SUN0867